MLSTITPQKYCLIQYKAGAAFEDKVQWGIDQLLYQRERIDGFFYNARIGAFDLFL